MGLTVGVCGAADHFDVEEESLVQCGLSPGDDEGSYDGEPMLSRQLTSTSIESQDASSTDKEEGLLEDLVLERTHKGSYIRRGGSHDNLLSQTDKTNLEVDVCPPSGDDGVDLLRSASLQTFSEKAGGTTPCQFSDEEGCSDDEYGRSRSILALGTSRSRQSVASDVSGVSVVSTNSFIEHTVRADRTVSFRPRKTTLSTNIIHLLTMSPFRLSLNFYHGDERFRISQIRYQRLMPSV